MFSITEHKNIPILRLQGRLDAYVIPSIEVKLEEILEQSGPPRIIVNLMGVQYLDGAAIDALALWRERFKEQHGDLKLSSMRQTMRMRLKIENLARFNIYDNDEAAYVAFQTGE